MTHKQDLRGAEPYDLASLLLLPQTDFLAGQVCCLVEGVVEYLGYFLVSIFLFERVTFS
jgi:hypothetical protein